MNKKHLVINMPNWVGDVIMTLPSLDALYKAGFTFELLGKPWLKELFSAYSYPTHCLPVNWQDRRNLYLKFKEQTMILFANSWSTVLPSFRTGIKTIAYYRSYLQKFFLTYSLKKPSNLHEIEYFWNLTQFAVKRPLLIPKNPNLLISENYQAQADSLIKQFNLENGFYVICPGAIGKAKIWPQWQNLCDYLSKQTIPLVICPAPNELQIFTEKFSQYAVILPNLNLALYAALMKRARQVIANDSGPMHLAAAVQTPVLGVFGQTDPQRTHPWGGKYIGELNNWPSCDEVIKSITEPRP